MAEINRITISGFRGIASLLELPFKENKTAGSMILYGRNGTGKSSVTDAWEWLTTGKIQHLAKEGAEEGSYPYMSAKSGSTFVEIEFANPSIGTVRLTYDEQRPKSPRVTGHLDALRVLVSHPCHVRHTDLTRFVLLRKSERYDALATLMGFVPQMEYQKALRRIESAVSKDVTNERTKRDTVMQRYEAHFTDNLSEGLTPLELLARRCASSGAPCEPALDKIKEAAAILNQTVVNDPKAHELAGLVAMKSAVEAFVPQAGLSEKLASLRMAIGNLRTVNEADREQLLRLPALQEAQTFACNSSNVGVCPVCNKSFDGDLKEHIATELTTLRHLDLLLQQLLAAKDSLHLALSAPLSASPVTLPSEFLEHRDLSEATETFAAKAQAIRDFVSTAKELLVFDTSRLSEELTTSFSLAEVTSARVDAEFDAAKATLIQRINSLKQPLEANSERQKLINDRDFVSIGLRLFNELATANNRLSRIQTVSNTLGELVTRYVTKTLTDVNKRFAQISDKVKVFFGLLEKDTPGIGEPNLKLDTGHDRSVILEVGFHGKTINPAYKYLSESQLNSFGLAVSLASATQFNRGFSFLLLDDIVNSCDAEKRPKLIDLLQTHLCHVQILLMTHDKLWRDLLQKRLPKWVKFDFRRYEVGIGPICKPSMNPYERIESFLKDDEAENASGEFARYLEDSLQEMCEAFEVELKFNRRNEYTLDPLLTGLRTRLEKKLQNHNIVASLKRVTEDAAYRNWATHYKNPVSPIHSAEIGTVVANWRSFETQVYCTSCETLLRYDNGSFKCDCGKTTLQRVT